MNHRPLADIPELLFTQTATRSSALEQAHLLQPTKREASRELTGRIVSPSWHPSDPLQVGTTPYHAMRMGSKKR
jgi:hypothetical protein